jgi:ATP-binding cassette subfamily F protein 3
MLQLIDIEHSIGERTLFSDVTININPHDRYGLVGANGTGKTTLLRIMIGEISPTHGYIKKPKGTTIGYLPQEEIVLHGNILITEVLKDYNVYLEKMSQLRTAIAEDPYSKKLFKEYEDTESTFQKIGGYDYEAEAYKVIHGLGFTQDDHTKLVQEFSSGWQMRIVLARLLLNNPDLLLLDEPTNHLDIESIQWLENYLQNFKGALIVVSHDRFFLDKFLQGSKGSFGIYEIDIGTFRTYRTNYTGYLQESQIRKQRMLQLAKIQTKRITEIKEFIARNRANKSKAKLVKSREKYLERIERIQVESDRKAIQIRFPVEEIHSRRLVELKNVKKTYDEKVVFQHINVCIERSDKIALIGKNGVGKSTLCRIIAGYETPSEGKRRASEKLKIGSFSHEILLKLNPSNTVLEEVAIDAAQEAQQNLRKFLGLFLFTGDDVFKKIDILSGGEKTRLVILKAMIESTNLLILDEPTYHLDKDSVDAIKQAIDSYRGTIILVTHDRDLIANFATRIVELKNGALYDYPGDYSYYLWKRNGGAVRTSGMKKTKKSAVERLKQQIIQKESRRQKLRNTFSRPSMISNLRKSKKLFDEYQRLSEEIADLENRLSLNEE